MCARARVRVCVCVCALACMFVCLYTNLKSNSLYICVSISIDLGQYQELAVEHIMLMKAKITQRIHALDSGFTKTHLQHR